ncbi:hypothetical protein [Candidatus Solincola sp.]|jgi:small nuclear ribonucleoprotein (snRNP)-like protein|nr:hypothetical protein [Actinomycetota bacterium]MDI7252382.1 hypothetical protein [Actinomycetota bacterium]
MQDTQAFMSLLSAREGGELMVWTRGGHYFRGNLEKVDETGLLVLRDVSCTLAGERQEREKVYLSPEAVDAVSWE